MTKRTNMIKRNYTIQTMKLFGIKDYCITHPWCHCNYCDPKKDFLAKYLYINEYNAILKNEDLPYPYENKK